jgi:DNA-binding MarR family transcriptional regulator
MSGACQSDDSAFFCVRLSNGAQPGAFGLASKKRSRAGDAKPPQVKSIEQLLDYKIGYLRKLLDRYSSPGVLEQFGLSLAEWRMVSHIQAGRSVTAFWLCRRLQADRAEVSRACASLINRGYVVSKPNPADARSALLELTPAGQAMFRRIMPVRFQLQKELIDVLGRREIAVLYRALDKLTDAISEKVAPSAGKAAGRASRKRAPARRAAQ